MAAVGLDYDILAKDNLRTLSLPEASFNRPVCVVFVGYPASGKTFLTRKLRERLPFTVLSEAEMTAFLAPRATIFKRGSVEVFQLAVKTIEQIILAHKACLYDANVKTREQRELIKTVVEQTGGSYTLVYLRCPKEVCYKRLQKHNLEVTRGETKGFIMDKDFFEYEIASTTLPSNEEPHITFDCNNPESLFQITTRIENQIQESS